MLFHHYGFRETLFYTVIFGVSRGLGPLAQLIWDRVLALPIERPKSVSLENLKIKAEDISRREADLEKKEGKVDFDRGIGDSKAEKVES